MRYAPRALLAGGLGLAISFLVACGGGGGLLSGGQASGLNSRLDAVSVAIDNHHCGAASRAVVRLDRAVANLPSSVNAELRGNLAQGVSTVSDAVSQCQTTSSTTTTSSTPTSSSTTTTSSSSSTPTSSTTTTTTSSQTTSSSTATSTSTPTSAPGSGGAGLPGNNGNGNGNGNGQ